MTPYNGFVFPLLPPQDVPNDQKKRFNGLFANLQTRIGMRHWLTWLYKRDWRTLHSSFRHGSPRYLHRN
jgi:hypothetical protein